MSQNPPKPCFHEIHSNDILISRNYTAARRVESKDNGLVFTSTPIKINEKTSIKLVEVSEKHRGIVSIGFTSRDPATLRYDIAKCNRTEIRRKPGFWTCSLSKNLCVKNKILFFYVTADGNIHYGLDGEEKGHAEKNVNTEGQLWALIDIWSPQTAIQLWKTPKPKTEKIQETVIETNKNSSLKYHKKSGFAYIFTAKPLPLDQMVEIKFLHEDTLALGVTSFNPKFLPRSELPEKPDALLDRSEYWVVINDPTMTFETNDELSYSVTKSGEMKIWKNSSLLLKVVHVDPTSDLWGFFVVADVGNIDVTVPKTEVQHESQKDEDLTCVICLENNREAALYPCGHMCMCFQCARKQWRGEGGGHCPVCRARIHDVLKVYK